MKRAVLFDMFETLITHYRTPLYFSGAMAADAGMEEETFRTLWRATESDRTLGRLTLRQTLTDILAQRGMDDPQRVAAMVQKRTEVKEQLFAHLHPGILPLLQQLQQRGIQIGLVSNCFDEEAAVIRRSCLMPYFGSLCLSCELGVAKPDRAIFTRCLEQLQVSPEDCLYVGDGGSRELETAQALGMQPLQALWYLPDGAPISPNRAFPGLHDPLQVLNHL